MLAFPYSTYQKTNIQELTQATLEYTNKTFVGLFLWPATSQKFELATGMLSRDQKMSSTKRIIQNKRVRNNETFYKEVGHRCWRQKKSSEKKLEIPQNLK